MRGYQFRSAARVSLDRREGRRAAAAFPGRRALRVRGRPSKGSRSRAANKNG